MITMAAFPVGHWIAIWIALEFAQIAVTLVLLRLGVTNVRNWFVK